MTPAINQLKQAKVAFQIHSYDHDPNTASYGEEAAEKLGLDPHRVFKTLLVKQSSGQLAVAVVPVNRSLDLKAIGNVLSCKKVAMADPAEAQRVTGYLVGGISPIGQKKRLATVIDASAFNHASIFVSGGRRGLDLELSPADLQQILGGQRAEIAR